MIRAWVFRILTKTFPSLHVSAEKRCNNQNYDCALILIIAVESLLLKTYFFELFVGYMARYMMVGDVWKPLDAHLLETSHQRPQIREGLLHLWRGKWDGKWYRDRWQTAGREVFEKRRIVVCPMRLFLYSNSTPRRWWVSNWKPLPSFCPRSKCRFANHDGRIFFFLAEICLKKSFRVLYGVPFGWSVVSTDILVFSLFDPRFLLSQRHGPAFVLLWSLLLDCYFIVHFGPTAPKKKIPRM